MSVAYFNGQLMPLEEVRVSPLQGLKHSLTAA